MSKVDSPMLFEALCQIVKVDSPMLSKCGNECAKLGIKLMQWSKNLALSTTTTNDF